MSGGEEIRLVIETLTGGAFHLDIALASPVLLVKETLCSIQGKSSHTSLTTTANSKQQTTTHSIQVFRSCRSSLFGEGRCLMMRAPLPTTGMFRVFKID